MGVATTVAALQALHATIAGITAAPTARPVERFSASLPCVILRPGALQMIPDARAGVEKRRSYEGVCLVVQPNQGRGIAEGLARTQALMDAFSAFYEAHIEGGAALSTGGLVVGYRDAGEPQSLIQYGADELEGFAFTVDVWEG